MSLISFPISPENIKEKVFNEAPVQAYNPSGTTGYKAEYTYTVPTGRKSIVMMSFSVTIPQSSTNGQNPIGAAAGITLMEFVKAGDIIYSGVRAYTSNNSPYNHNYEFFYNLNGVNIYQKLLTNIASAGNPLVGSQKVNHTVEALQFDP
jgi:hypothetical protein